VVHGCFRAPPDTDGDGVPDAAESYPLDPQHAVAEDQPPPAPDITGPPDQWTRSQAAVFDYSAPGAVEYWCSLDGDPVANCDPSGRTYSNLQEGGHTFRVRALDSLGLVSEATTYSWTIDRTAPNTVFGSRPPATVLVDRGRFAFSSNEPGVRFFCRRDAANYGPCDSPTTWSGLSDGWHTFRVAAVDRAGNGDPTPAAASFQVRTVPTAPTITSGPAAGSSISSPRPTFGFQARFATRYQCRFDRQAFGRCSAARSHTPSQPLGAGSHTFEVRGIGGTGKPGPSTIRHFSINR
jgi:hypothetical protein